MMYATFCRSNTLCATGPKEKLDCTAVSQPAIYVASLAALEKLRQQEGEVSHALWAPSLWQALMHVAGLQVAMNADVTCGLSLGEYTALTFADAMRYVSVMAAELPNASRCSLTSPLQL